MDTLPLEFPMEDEMCNSEPFQKPLGEGHPSEIEECLPHELDEMAPSEHDGDVTLQCLSAASWFSLHG